MLMLIDCSSCRTPLQLPAGARCLRCIVCGAVTYVAAGGGGGGSVPPMPSPSPHSSNNYGFATAPPWGPAHPSPSPHGRKRAVICGIAYRNTRHELRGSVTDAAYMKHLLVNRFKFPESSVIVLTDDQTDPYRIPTKHNIRMAMYWLVQGCQAGDSLVFHYSGHGSQQRNYTGDEIDGFDETLCPLDFETQGMIVDDEINATIVRPLPSGVKLHAFVDACHSGTVLDLPFLCRMNRSGRCVWEDHRPRSGTWKGTSGGEAISFSGCDDNQTSADTSAFSRVTPSGAMTYCFILAIEKGHGTTYGSILNYIRSTIRSTGDAISGGPISTLLAMLFTGGSPLGGLRQEPQLTSNEPFDVYNKPFSL
uniref:Metacaspase n=1 Tax=Vriesea carinata TaxID=294102 RepID=A0A346M6T8_9POAL|nr:metacaspase [Vriesea carinata]